jgi:ferredoxin--NADP+ reductase
MLALADEELAPTDTTDAAIAAITAAGVREILMLGRRGPAQGAFTTPELQELGELAAADVIVDPADLALDPASAAALEVAGAIPKRNMEVLREYAARTPAGKTRAIRLRFCVSPTAILGDGRVEAVGIVRNRLVPDGHGGVRAEPTHERETIQCGLVLRSVGYRGVPIDGVPFDDARGVMPNDGGRVLGADGLPLRGLYCAGWIKRGPTGVIGTNKKDAAETVAFLLEDAAAGRLARDEVATAEAVDTLLAERGVHVVTQSGWEAIDRVERERGEPQGRPRVKLSTWPELLAAAGL